MVLRVSWWLLLVSWLAGPASAQDSVPPAPAQPAGVSTLAGVYTTGQAEKGAQNYKKNCTECHAPIAYTGLAFRRVWSGRSVFDFFDLIRTTMPNDSPGKLSRGEYAEIMAYLLKLNGLPAGEKDLPDNDDELKTIRIELPPRATP